MCLISGEDMALYCQLRNDIGQQHNNNDCYVVDCYVVEVFSFIHQYWTGIFFSYYRNKTLCCFYWLKGFFLKATFIFFLPVTKWTCTTYMYLVRLTELC